MITLDQLNELQKHVGHGCNVYLNSYTNGELYIQIEAKCKEGPPFRFGILVPDRALYISSVAAEFMADVKRNAKHYFDCVFNEEDYKMNKYTLGEQKTLSELCQKKDEQIEFLWGLLDDISTAGDIYKPEITGYFQYVNSACEKRLKVATSDDGQGLDIKGLYS